MNELNDNLNEGVPEKSSDNIEAEMATHLNSELANTRIFIKEDFLLYRGVIEFNLKQYSQALKVLIIY